MSIDARKNFAYGTVLTAPTPATSGTTMTLSSGAGALMPAVPFNLTIWPTGANPLASTAEIVRVTAMTGDSITAMTRAQEGTSARTIVAGDQVAQTWTKKFVDDVETDIAAKANTASPTLTGTVTIAASGKISQTPSGTTAMTLWQMNTPVTAEDTAPYELYLGGAEFASKWNPVLYYGYNASGADATEPIMRQVIEGLYSHGTDDFEMYWEYRSTDRATGQRPIFFYRERDGVNHGLVFNTDAISFAPRDGNTSTLQDLNYTFYGSQTNLRSASYGISMWAGAIDSDAGFRLYASPYTNTDYSGATIIRASADSSGASVNTAAYAVSLMTNAEARLVVRADGKIAFNYNDDFTNYERLGLTLTSGLATFASESAGTGAANMGIAFTPKGTGVVTVNGGTVIAGGTVTSAVSPLSITETRNASGVTFPGIVYNVTNTASAAASLLQKWQIDGASVAELTMDGRFAAGTGTSGTGAGFRFLAQPNIGMYLQATNIGAGSNALVLRTNNGVDLSLGAGQIRFGSNLSVGFASGTDASAASIDTGVYRDAAGTLAQRNGTNAQTFRLYNTYTDSSNYERLGLTWSSNVIRIGAANAGTGTARVLTLDYGGTTTAAISVPITSGAVSFGGGTIANSGTAIPAGGTAGAGVMMSSTTNFGVFFGSGAPTLSAAKGSLYLRSDGSTTNDRAYINSDGGTTWVALTTAS